MYLWCISWSFPPWRQVNTLGIRGKNILRITSATAPLYLVHNELGDDAIKAGAWKMMGKSMEIHEFQLFMEVDSS